MTNLHSYLPRWMLLVGLTILFSGHATAEVTRVWEFANPQDLSDWTVRDRNSFAAKVFTQLEVVPESNGLLRAQTQAGTWFASSSGGMLSRQMSGDFVISTRLRVYGAAFDVPQGSFEQAGLIVRKPNPEDRISPANWEYLVTGGHGQRRILDYKTTRKTVSRYLTREVKGPWIELRLARWGDKIVKLWREDGGDWNWVDTQTRADLVGELEVGLCFLSNFSGTSDLHVDIDRVTLGDLPEAPTAVPKDASGWESFLGR